MNLRNILLGAISVAAVAAMADSAAAQSTGTSATATAPAAAKIIQPLTMTAVSNTALNFGTVTLGTTASTVTLTAASTTTRGKTGDIVLVTSGAQSSAPSAAQFTAAGEPSAAITVTAADVTLTSGSNHLTVNPAFAGGSNASGTTTYVTALDNTGSLALPVGGTLNLPANMVAGAYSGTLSVTVTYN